MANPNRVFSKGYEMATREKLAEAEGLLRSTKSRLRYEPTIFQRLKREHGEMEGLFKQITGSDVAVRLSLFPRLARELRVHSFAEDRSVYSWLGRHEETRKAAGRSARTHQDLNALVGTLERGDFGTDAWMQDFALLRKLFERHVIEEETEMMPKARTLLGHSAFAALEASYLAAKALAPRSEREG